MDIRQAQGGVLTRHDPMVWVCRVFNRTNRGWPIYPPQGVGTLAAAWYALRHPWLNLPREDAAFDASWLYCVQSRRWSGKRSDNDGNDMLLLRGTGWIYRLAWRIGRPWTVRALVPFFRRELLRQRLHRQSLSIAE